jgi:hypothetical protein
LHADDSASASYVTKIPPVPGLAVYSVSQEAGTLNSIGAVLGNDVAIKAYREAKLPFPDGTIIALCATATFRRRKTTKSLAKPNLSFLGKPRIFSLW